MSDKKQKLDEVLDRAAESLSQERLAPDQVRDMGERVASRLGSFQPTSLRGCDDFQALIPDYLSNGLSEGRRLLFEDHVRGCVTCRRKLVEARGENPSAMPETRRRLSNQWLRWGAVAAGLLMMALLFQTAHFNGWLPWDQTVLAQVEESSGTVLRLTAEGPAPVTAGGAIDLREVIRTGHSSGALLKLNDGSLVEMAERTELSLTRGWRGETIRLARGNVIVEAAEEDREHLFVLTDDCRVAVKGTVFSVSHGMRGSRVSVLEGEVWVEESGMNRALHPGQQYASQLHLARVPLKEEFAWSRDAAKHLELLGEISTLTDTLEEATYSEFLRYSSNLVGLLPEETVVYGALPNLSDQLHDVYQLFRERVAASPALQTWLAEHSEPGESLDTLDGLVARVRAVGEQLGPEVVVALSRGGGSGDVAPLLLAEVLNRPQIVQLLQEEIARLESESDQQIPIYLVEEELPSRGEGLFILISGGYLIASPELELLEEVVAIVGSDQASPFSETRFFETVAQSYAEGVDWLFALDLDRVVAASPAAGGSEVASARALESLGIEQMQDLVIERKRTDGVSENRALLTYEASGEGMVSWLAKPGPVGALDFVSANANLAAAFTVGSPVRLVDNLLGYLTRTQPDLWQSLLEFEQENGISIRRDVAQPLGGEVALALDGPMLPTPAWKIIVEVYEPAVLQRTLEWALNEISARSSVEEGLPALHLFTRNVGGETLYEIAFGENEASVYYRYLEGYLILTADPVLIEQAIQYRRTGYTLAASAEFNSLLVRDTRVNQSALLYHNLSPLLEPLLSSGVAESIAGELEGKEALQALIGGTPPMLVSVYCEPGRITVASGGDIDSLWSNLATLASLGGPEGLVRLIEAPAR